MTISSFPDKEVREYLGIRAEEGSFYAVDLSPEELQHLVDIGAAFPETSQNDGPDLGEFLREFSRDTYSNVSFIGYVVLPPRHDARISIEGVLFTVKDALTALDTIVNKLRYADELSYDELPGGSIAIRAWWD